MLTFTVRVAFTDRSTAGGAFVTRQRAVSVLADTDTEAACVAAQLIACVIPTDSMVVSTTITEVIA